MQALLDVLNTIEKPGSFCCSGNITPCYLGLEVKSLGAIGLPLSPTQAKDLIAHCQQAPFGRGEQTVVDTDVRKVWQLDPSQFEITNPEWQQKLTALCDLLKTELGVVDYSVRCELYKLLIYETGDFFLPHRDTEKLDKMFATLVIVLPSAHEGGELRVSHDGQTETFTFGGADSSWQIRYAAFYADCEHEVKPVTQGYRLCLTYNLALADCEHQPHAPKNSPVVSQLKALLSQWAAREDSEKLAILLDHHYTPVGLSLSGLKNLDQAKAQVLFEAAKQADCQAHLALVTLWESGDAEESYYSYSSRRRRRYGYDDDEDEDSDGYEMGEIFDSSLSVDYWMDANGKPQQFGEMELNETEIVSEREINDRAPDKQEVSGPTGNEGMPMERWYYQAAIVIWPNKHHLALLCSTGEQFSVPQLQAMLQAKAEGYQATTHEFAKHILNYWRETTPHHSAILSEQTLAQKLLACLLTMDDWALLQRFLTHILPQELSGREGEDLLQGCRRYGWQTMRPLLVKLSAQTQIQKLAAFSDILLTLCQAQDDAEQNAICCELAESSLQNFEQWLAAKESTPDWIYQNMEKNVEHHGVRIKLVVTLFKTLHHLAHAELLAAWQTCLCQPHEKLELRSVLAPIVQQIHAWLVLQNQRNPYFDAVLNNCRALIQAEATKIIEEPSDWVQAVKLSCQCEDCTELQSFLHDPKAQVHRFRVRKDRRQHLHQQINSYHLDMTHVTERSGSPQTLICTKTRFSYQKAKQQQAADTQLWQTLETLTGGTA